MSDKHLPVTCDNCPARSESGWGDTPLCLVCQTKEDSTQVCNEHQRTFEDRCPLWHGPGMEPTVVAGPVPASPRRVDYNLPPGMTEADLLRSTLKQVLDKADPLEGEPSAYTPDEDIEVMQHMHAAHTFFVKTGDLGKHLVAAFDAGDKRRKRKVLMVSIDLDPVPGVFSTPESAAAAIQSALQSSIPHYNPVVTPMHAINPDEAQEGQ